MAKRKVFQMRLDGETEAAIRMIAAHNKVTMTEAVTEAINLCLRDIIARQVQEARGKT